MGNGEKIQERHRPGVYKQQNKSHKHGKHRSKGEIDAANKGKTSIKTLSKKARRDLKKQERRNQAQQIRAKKRDEILAKKRGLGSPSTPPFLTAIVSLSADVDVHRLLNLLENVDSEVVVNHSPCGIQHLCVPRFKQRFAFIVPRPGDLYGILDAAKIVDTVLLLFPLQETLDTHGELILAGLFAQGLPATVHVALGDETIPLKKKTDYKKNLIKYIEKRFPKEKLNFVEKESDCLLVLRQIGNQRQRPVYYRDRRAHILAEAVDFEGDGTDVGTLKISGYIRAQPLSVNRLIHFPLWGTYQLSQIDVLPDPHSQNLGQRNSVLKNSDEMHDTEEIRLVERVNPSLQESLDSENVPDPMAGEQTWPTDEEIKEAEVAQQSKRIVKRVPKGTSEYQAAWILESDGEVNSQSDDEEIIMKDPDIEIMEEDDDGSLNDSCKESDAEEEFESLSIVDGCDENAYDEGMDVQEEEKTMKKFKQARLNEMFPDEIDTPLDAPARIRFQKYRGLKSFRTSPWDPKENLPFDYARLFQFQNFNRTRKRVLSEDKDGAMVGWYVTLHIVNFPKYLFDCYNSKIPLIAYQPLEYEQKMSVLNVVLKHHSSNSEPIKSKERLIFHIGYRRFFASPIFSQHTNGTRHKYERFLRTDCVTVATLYAPVIFPPSSVLVFKETKNGDVVLIATGSVLDVNPDRIIAKRVILSGHSFKINKRSAVVRYMFFNKEDINWFKPVELRTKYGRRGHIKEPLGTHGHMKCYFDGPLKSQDTVLMNLYKRVYPKWTYGTLVTYPPPLFSYPYKEDCTMSNM